MVRRALILAYIGSLAGGCDADDDGGPVDADTGTTADTSATGDGEVASSETAEATDGGVGDVAPDALEDVAIDRCEPNPCTEPPSEPACSLDRTTRGVAAEGPGACVALEDGHQCTYTMEPTACGPEALCSLGACVQVGTYCDWPVDDGPWTFGVVHRFGGIADEIDPETGHPIDECCFDLDGKGGIDNGFGAMMRRIGSFFPSDINSYFAERIESLATTFVSQLRGAPEPASDLLVGARRVDLLGLTGHLHDDSGDPFAGDGLIVLHEQSFVVGTVIPRVHIELELDDGAIVGADGIMGFAIGEQLKQVEVVVTRAEGELTLGEGGFGFATTGDGGRGARFGGYIPRSAWLTIWNEHAAEFCTCTTFDSEDGNVIELATGACAPAVSTCTEPDAICRLFASALCQGVVDMMEADHDTDGDGEPDAISAGWWTRSVPTRVHGTLRHCD